MVTNLDKKFMRHYSVFIAILLLFTMSSCKDNDVNADDGLSVRLDQQQPPFGIDSAKLQIKNLLFDGNRAGSFTYERGYLEQIDQYASFDSSAKTATIKFNRVNLGLTEINSRQSELVWYEENFVSNNWVDGKLFKYAMPTTDSLREISEQWFLSDINAKSIYHLNKKGYVTRHEFLTPTTPSYSTVTTYFRDNQNNIKTSVYETSVSGEKVILSRDYKYDDKSNPFFEIGFDRYGDISIFSLSPNNITKITYTDEVGNIFVEDYTYTYNNSGYPTRVALQVTRNNVLQSATHELLYSYY